jgi:site-specific DNA-methyltransferase (adenine-specific)
MREFISTLTPEQFDVFRRGIGGYLPTAKLDWCYAAGFPKSANLGKIFDKKNGNEREDFIREDFAKRSNKKPQEKSQVICGEKGMYSKGTSPYEGLGTGLKPAHEPICMARKPLSEKTIVDNVVKWGVGGLGIDNCRIPCASASDMASATPQGRVTGKVGALAGGIQNENKRTGFERPDNSLGRFPANILCQDDALNDGEMTKSPKSYVRNSAGYSTGNSGIKAIGEESGKESLNFADSGSKSRYFDIDIWAEKHGLLQFPKASKEEKNEGCDMLFWLKGKQIEEDLYRQLEKENEGLPQGKKHPIQKGNIHPTVKPLSLMMYLVTLISREGQTVCDPFMGSGTTGVACQHLNRNFIGIEIDPEYIKIAQKRIDAARSPLMEELREYGK